MEAITQQEVSEAAGNLKAELLAASDGYRTGQMSRESYLNRVRTIRQCGKRWSAVWAPTRERPVVSAEGR